MFFSLDFSSLAWPSKISTFGDEIPNNVKNIFLTKGVQKLKHLLLWNVGWYGLKLWKWTRVKGKV
jgi:hypothetical protein